MSIKMVTMTGADDSLHPAELVELSEKYPFVEWGILFSGSKQGCARFPSYEWLDELKRIRTLHTMNLSAHLCGSHVRDFCLEGIFDIQKEHFFDIFDRVQLNFHSIAHKVDIDKLCSTIGKYHDSFEFIFQLDGVNNHIPVTCSEKVSNIAVLHDKSGGIGVLPSSWSEPIPNLYNGYAGGLGPDNLKAQLAIITSVTKSADIWVDMETKIRSYDDKQFDLSKVAQCLDIANKFIYKGAKYEQALKDIMDPTEWLKERGIEITTNDPDAYSEAMLAILEQIAKEALGN